MPAGCTLVRRIGTSKIRTAIRALAGWQEANGVEFANFDNLRGLTSRSSPEDGSRTYLLVCGNYIKSFGPAQRDLKHEKLSAKPQVQAKSNASQLHFTGGKLSSSVDEEEPTGIAEEDNSEEDDLRSRLLDTALKYVEVYGWTVAAVQKAATDLKLSPAVASIFDRPEAALVKHFVDKCNAELSQKLQKNKGDLMGMRMSERLRTALQWRLEMLIPVMGKWTQALAIQSSLSSAPTSLKQLFDMVSDIWYACGDTAADLSWYNKRLYLAAAYTQTELYMLSDYSPGYADTWEALDRRCAEMQGMGQMNRKAMDSIKQLGRHMTRAMGGSSSMFTQMSQQIFQEQPYKR